MRQWLVRLGHMQQGRWQCLRQCFGDSGGACVRDRCPTTGSVASVAQRRQAAVMGTHMGQIALHLPCHWAYTTNVPQRGTWPLWCSDDGLQVWERIWGESRCACLVFRHGSGESVYAPCPLPKGLGSIKVKAKAWMATSADAASSL